MVSVDNYINETTRHAQVILPGLSPLEQPHYDEMIWSWALRNAGKYSPALFPPGPGRPAEWEILLALAAIAGGMRAREIDIGQLDDLYFGGVVGMVVADPRSRIAGRKVEEIVAMTGRKGPERLLDFAIRTGPDGDAYGADPRGLTLRAMQEHRHGIDMGPLEPCLAKRLRTRSGKIELAPPYITADLGRLRTRLRRHDAGLVLISRRDVRSNNSWMHNVEKLVRGRNRCALLVHPGDARRAGLTNGGRARIASAAGSITVEVEVTAEMMPGVVCLPHGWGHDREGTRLTVAARYPGANSNRLAPADLIDVPSGNAVVNGIPVALEPATGP